MLTSLEKFQENFEISFHTFTVNKINYMTLYNSENIESNKYRI